MSGIIGFIFIFRVIKYMFSVIINGLHIYQTVGGGIAMFACVWNTLTRWVIHRYQQSTAQTLETVTENVELGATDNRLDNNAGEPQRQEQYLYPTVGHDGCAPQYA